MRGSDETRGSLFSYVDLEERIPARHPLRKIRQIVNDALVSMDPEFDRLYAVDGRASIAPERLLRASLIQILFSIRSERQLMEQMQYNLLFRWFVGLGIDDPVWVPTVFTKNRDRLLTADIARKFLAAILAHREVSPLLSDEHFSVDGTLVKAWASMKSFQPKPEAAPSGSDSGPHDPPPPPPAADAEAPCQTNPETAPMTPAKPKDGNAEVDPKDRNAEVDPKDRNAEVDPKDRNAEVDPKDRNAEVDFRGQKRSNATHASVTDPEARLYRKSPGTGASLCFIGHTLMENRHGLIVQTEMTQADGHAERRAALDMIRRHSPGSTRRLTVAADKGYDCADFVSNLRQACVTPHVARKIRHSAIDGRTTRHPGYELSQKRRKKIEEPFGWAKTVGPMAQTMLRGVKRVGAQFTLTMAACNLARLPRLLAA